MSSRIFILQLAALATLPTALGACTRGRKAGQMPPLPPLLEPGIPAFPGAWGGGMFSTGGS